MQTRRTAQLKLYLAIAFVVEEHICRLDVAMNALQHEKTKEQQH